MIGASSRSPQHAHRGPLWTGNSVQQTWQMGTEERCGRGEPQRTHEAGKRAQLKASMGLRSTRATARQREVSEGGRSKVSEPESLRKTHLASGRLGRSARRHAVSIPVPRRGFHENSSSGVGSGSRVPAPGPNSGWLVLLRLCCAYQPVFLSPAAMPLMVAAMARFTSAVSSPACLRRSIST